MTEENLNENILTERVESYIINLINEYHENLFLTNTITRSSYSSFYNSISNLRKNILHSKFIDSLKNSVIKFKAATVDISNPYPIMYNELRNYCIRISNNLTDFETMPEPTNIIHLYKRNLLSYDQKTDQSIFGLFPLMKICDPRMLSTSRNLAKKILPSQMKSFKLVSSVESVTVQSILSSTMLPFVESYEFRIDFFIPIRSTQIEIALDSFYDAIDYHLNLMVKSGGGIILDITIPNISSDKNEVKFDNYSVLSYNDWKNENIHIKDQVNKLAIIHMKEYQKVPYIVVEILIDNLPKSQYEKVRIRYTANALQYKETVEQKEIWSYFGNNENNFINNMLESIFFDQASAEIYMKFILYKSYLSKNENTENLQRDSLIENLFTAFSNEQKLNLSFIVEEKPIIFEKFKFSNDKLMVKSNNQIFQDFDNMDKSLWKISFESIENHWIDKVVRSRKIIDFFMILENVLKLVLFESKLIPEEFNLENLKQEIFFILNSPVYHLFCVIQQNMTLRQIIYSFHQHGQIDIIVIMFRKLIVDLQNSLQDLRLKNFVSFNKTIVKKMENRIKKFVNKSPELITIETMLELRFYNSVCSFLLWQLIQDILCSCQKLSNLIDVIQLKYSQQEDKNENLLKDFEFASEIIFCNVKSDSVTNKSKTKSQNRNLLEVLKEENFAYYWNLFCNKAVSMNSFNFISNPFNILSRYLHLASIRFELKSILITDLQNKTTINSLELINSEFDLYKMKDFDIYGSKISLSQVDAPSIQKLSTLLKKFDCGIYETRKSIFQAFISTGILGQLSFRGHIDPHIRLIELIDYIYITGPNDCLMEASQYFAQLVIQNLKMINQDSLMTDSICLGLFVTELNKSWSIAELLKNPREAMIQIGKFAESIKNICAKFYIKYEWRYLPMVKYFRFHFTDMNKVQLNCVNYKDIENLESFKLLFFTKESANGFFQFSEFEKSVESNNLKRIYKANKEIDKVSDEYRKSLNWIKYFEAILTKSLINENLENITEIAKIFYSSFGHLCYLNILNKTIQNLLFSVIESNSFAIISIATSKIIKSTKTKCANLTVLTNTFRCYYYIITKLVENENLRHFYMWEQILYLLNEICFVHSNNNQIDIIPSAENIQKLEQLRQILENIEDIYGFGCWKNSSIYKSY